MRLKEVLKHALWEAMTNAGIIIRVYYKFQKLSGGQKCNEGQACVQTVTKWLRERKPHSLILRKILNFYSLRQRWLRNYTKLEQSKNLMHNYEEYSPNEVQQDRL